jgi:hypothetical protein
VGNTSLDYSVNFWTEGVFSTALGVFGVAGIGIRIEESAVIASDTLLKRGFLLLIHFVSVSILSLQKCLYELYKNLLTKSIYFSHKKARI